MGENVAGTGIRTYDLLTWIIWRWLSAILTAFSHLSVCQGPKTSSHYHLGDLVVAGKQPELHLDYPALIAGFYSSLTSLSYEVPLTQWWIGWILKEHWGLSNQNILICHELWEPYFAAKTIIFRKKIDFYLIKPTLSLLARYFIFFTSMLPLLGLLPSRSRLPDPWQEVPSSRLLMVDCFVKTIIRHLVKFYVSLGFATTQVDLLFIELTSHLSRVKHLSRKLILISKITRQG